MFLRKKDQKKENLEEPKNITQIMILTEPMCEKLIKKNLGKYIEQDFLVKNDYRYARFSSEQEAEKCLRPYLNEILKYLNLSMLINFKVCFMDNENMSSGIAGHYQGGWGNKTITINISKSYTITNVLAIMCHECTHYFMEYNNLNWKDTNLNEERTDMMACIIGFANILANGYRMTEYTEYHLGYNRTSSHKIGYLTDKDCNEVYEYVKFVRKKLEHERSKKRELEGNKEKLHNLINLVEQFETQLELFDPEKNPSRYRDVSVSNINELQAMIADIKGLNSKNVLIELKNAYNSNDVSSILESIEKANKQCEKQSYIIMTLQNILK